MSRTASRGEAGQRDGAVAAGTAAQHGRASGAGGRSRWRWRWYSGRGGDRVGGGGVPVAKLVRDRAGGAAAGDAAGGPGQSVVAGAGDRDVGVRGLVHGAGAGRGTLTWLPSAGRVIGQGHVLYQVDNGAPVVLLYGPVLAGGPWMKG